MLIKSKLIVPTGKSFRLAGVVMVLSALTTLAGCAGPGIGQPAARLMPGALYEEVVTSAIRTADDRASDSSRKPAEFLRFAQVRQGMQVLDVAAGGGNTTQLLALAVGTGGKVYAQGQAARPALEKRLADNPQANIVPLIRPFDDPMPPGAPLLDLVTINLSYHDIVNLPIDRDKMNRRLYEVLKPGGRLVVIDHTGKPGSGISETSTLHRIEPALVRAEFERAGFMFEQAGTYLRNPADTLEKKSSDMERMTDKFALRFMKPAS